MAIRCAIIGASGYTGLELLRILSFHKEAEVTCTTSRTHKGRSVSSLFPSLNKIYDSLFFEDYSLSAVAERADVVFTAVPHQAAMDCVKELISEGLRAIDLSADFRLKDPSVYEAWYGEHRAKELLPSAVYGLTELFYHQIKDAALVANPGCYPTSAILPLYPLIKEKVIAAEGIVIDSKSGVSGAGRSASLSLNFSEVNEGFKAYKICSHRHTPEIEEALTEANGGSKVCVNFTPHLVPITRGILTTIYARLNADILTKDAISCLRDYYDGALFVRVLDEGVFPDVHNVRGSNFCDIGLMICKRTNSLIIVSAIDNLIKGASGQAVQNMNVMFGLDESAGILGVPLFP